MGDKATLDKARRELEELYLGVPDDSVNLTFQDLAEVSHQQQKIEKISSDKKKKASLLMEPFPESSPKIEAGISSLNKLPSLDFRRSIETSMHSNHNNNVHYPNIHHAHDNNHLHHVTHDHANDHPSRSHLHHQHGDHLYGHRETHHGHSIDHDHVYGHGVTRGHSDHHHAHGHGHHPEHYHARHGVESSMVLSDISGMSMASMHQQRGRGRRPGIPHSNICTVCSNYIYIFRHRCLVCGRVYCKQCLRIGMGEMSEGRKCIECLGRRFSQRYIQKAGHVGCCTGYPSTVKQQELIWAEKGPRRSGENRYGGSCMMPPRSRSPMSHRAHTASKSNTPSFVMSSPYSPYSTSASHALPL